MKDIATLKIMIMQLKYILDNKQKRQLVGLFLIVFLGALWEMLGVSIMLPFIQVLLTPEQLMEKRYILVIMKMFGIESVYGIIVLVCILIIFIYLIKNGYLIFSSYLQIKYKNSLLKNMSILMLRSYMNRSYQFFTNTNSGEIIRGITNDIAGVHDIIEISLKFLSEILVVILVGIYLIVTDPLMAIGVLLIGIVCLFLIAFSLKKRMSEMGMLNREALYENNKLAIQIIAGIKEIFVMQRRLAFLSEYEKSYKKREKATINYQFANACPERLIEAICISGIMAIIVIRLSVGINPQLFVPKLAVFAVAAFRILPSISRIAGYINGLVYNRPNLEAAYINIKNARKCLAKNNIEKYLDEKVCYDKVKFKHKIILNKVSWFYDNKAIILNELFLEICKGESIGIIGESGSGKSTLIDILLGLYQPKSGIVEMDGYSIFDIPYLWSKLIGYVPQTVFLLDDTIRNNISFGEHTLNDNDIWEALELASLKEFVEQLPEKLDTVVGERGIKFSGGQRQRVAIARALYHNPDILILDEATSALDNETEAVVMESINQLQGMKTLIIVAHRLSTIRKCDRIYEIKDGKAILQDKQRIFNNNII